MWCFLYTVVTEEGEEEEEKVRESFSYYNLAAEYARNQKKNFKIGKYKIKGTEALINNNLVGEIHFNEEGKIIFFGQRKN